MYEKYLALSEPVFKGNEIKYLEKCIETGWVSTNGEFVKKFEKSIAEFVGAKYAIACTSGTAALHIALKLIGVEKEDEVIVPTITFIAPINAVRYLNANPIFMDSDEFYNIDSEKVLEFLQRETVFKNGYTWNKQTNKRIIAILPVHIFGNAVNTEFFNFCRERNIKIVEDASESLGTKYCEGNYTQKFTSTIGDIGCLSFNGNKIITTGGGGMLITNNQNYAEKARYLTTQAKNDELFYIHDEIGFNYRLTNIQAAVGYAQMEKLNEYLSIKKENYAFLRNNLNNENFQLAATPCYADNNLWLYAIKTKKAMTNIEMREIINAFEKYKIQVRPLWMLNHLQKPYKNHFAYKIETAFNLYNCTLNIPSSVNLEIRDLDRVVFACRNIFGH